MPGKLIVFSIITFLHNLGTVIWIGGLISLGFFVFPALKKALKPSENLQSVMSAVQKRFQVPMIISIVVLTVSGILLSRRHSFVTGAFGFSNPYAAVLSVKHILVIGMVALSVIRTIVVRKKTGGGGITASDGGDGTAKYRKNTSLQKILLLLNIIFGIAVLYLSGVNSVMSFSMQRVPGVG